MENLWYAVLETVIQALASLFALSATFLIFKLETLNRELREFRTKAVRTLVYLERQSETRYDDNSLIQIADKFLTRVRALNPAGPHLGIGFDRYDDLKRLWNKLEAGFGYGSDKHFDEYFHFLLSRNATIFHSKVHYRLKLWSWASGTGMILTITILLALMMLSGLTHPLNIFNVSASYAIYFISVCACMCLIAVLTTIIYAVWGDEY